MQEWQLTLSVAETQNLRKPSPFELTTGPSTKPTLPQTPSSFCRAPETPLHAFGMWRNEPTLWYTGATAALSGTSTSGKCTGGQRVDFWLLLYFLLFTTVLSQKHCSGMVMFPVHQVRPKPSCKAQWKGEEDKADKGRGGKTTAGNGQAWSSPSPRGQWRTGKNGENWLQSHLWCPNDPHG